MLCWKGYNQQVFNEETVYTRQYPRCWRFSEEVKRWGPCSKRACILLGEIIHNQFQTVWNALEQWKKGAGKTLCHFTAISSIKSQVESIHKGIWRESIPDKGDSRCEWPRAGTHLMCLRYWGDGTGRKYSELATGSVGWGGWAGWDLIMWASNTKILFYIC